MSDSILDTTTLDPRAKPLIDALQNEYATRYEPYRKDGGAAAAQEMKRYPPEAFAPPHGAFVLLLRDGAAIAGGAFKRYDERTAELKRIWTRDDVRRQGLARKIVQALELRALNQGYTRVYLTTGFRQPEAWGLYSDCGYTSLFDSAVEPEVLVQLRYGKDLLEPGRTDTLDDLYSKEPTLVAHDSSSIASPD
ncbi:GNAT family N-acetyltransferase [Paraburkholderia xenovorans]|uniref:GNAT family N-acetyltransferase n=1 Tax=Paraburkholderia xenovorans TaxID=36873 RepID=UPI0038B996B0